MRYWVQMRYWFPRRLESQDGIHLFIHLFISYVFGNISMAIARMGCDSYQRLLDPLSVLNSVRDDREFHSGTAKSPRMKVGST